MRHDLTTAMEGYAMVEFLNAKDLNSALAVVAGSDNPARLAIFLADLATDLWNTVACECTCAHSTSRVAASVAQSRQEALVASPDVTLMRQAHDA